MRSSFVLSSVVAALALVAGCAHEQSTPVSTATTSSYVAPKLAPASPGEVNSNIYISDRLRSECGMNQIQSVNEAPKFAFDQSLITPEDRDVLAVVAKCVTTGPLAGKQLMLVGRADPRGTEQYNMALGERRSDAVMGYLGGLGVSTDKMKETSRGALDATGNDESAWRLDRRVDIDVR